MCLTPGHYAQKKSGQRSKPYSAFRISLQIVNTHLPTLKLIRDSFGGSFSVIEKKSSKHTQAYQLTWTQKQAVDLLRNLYPFLVTKKDQVGVLLAAWKPSSSGRKLSPEVVKQRMQAISKMQELKRVEYLPSEVN